ncbi:hypothetical protein OBBRIDRAFT_823054 [Obba rivulosa]|uniref:General stress protein FMN-binding split barrel domain-containing protein n=1 Tax=Obba rivulosa TaxID=1052685 RepID=A0A8E2J7E5_9APHY|nr:hypothetical protein OBBRIDRAFT_823054 [Obba rivulosa]
MPVSNKQQLDPYSAKAQNDNLTPQEKIIGLHSIVKAVKTGMLTTRSADGFFHSRAMAPAGPYSPTQASLMFVANRASDKFDEIQNDAHVNVSFFDESTTNWASYSGKARILQDADKIDKHWSPALSAWFGNLGDNVHKGDQHDPRVALIEVIPSEIRYWTSTQNAVTRAMNVAISAMTGDSAAPGELRTITADEIQLLEGMRND